ncbi:MAG: hypothetical protein HYZ20_08820 [Burkholderiales bacterium]|nr:hypothetical protein [Burkholderiales bacterium]
MSTTTLLGRPRLADTALDQPAVAPSALGLPLQTGDLWLSPGRPTNPMHFLLRLGTRSRWAHVGMLLRQGEAVFLIDATLAHSVRVIPIDEALRLEQMEGWSTAPVVLARPAALAGASLPGGLPEATGASSRQRIRQRVQQGFPMDYDLREILRIAAILLAAGLARRWRRRRKPGLLSRFLRRHGARRAGTRARLMNQTVARAAGLPPLTRQPGGSRWIWNKFSTAEARARRQQGEDPYTCAELVAELLNLIEGNEEMFDLTPEGDDFLSPACIAERLPLYVLGRVL